MLEDMVVLPQGNVYDGLTPGVLRMMSRGSIMRMMLSKILIFPCLRSSITRVARQDDGPQSVSRLGREERSTFNQRYWVSNSMTIVW